ncbi:probable trehalose-phosphate phosphatase 2 [Durio zibethinus]|uniref:Trehalose 6-phosphate phosphatase n=1 Tax=Durio zibethinus TaxID=66656 RepID=A0A6P6AH40_DURZI|nr:probable trehalose-phosphate phosphatase 2 [Durio zibethinus]XP_022764119.1 probable trehalose-phosphate phosphatase 2 [Durio zibethinus]XP_022764128.1 probable trehalose-phosphate phosphatase 2 [Durio zibethinus]
MVKRNLAKFNKTMGFQISHSNRQKRKPFLGPETDHDNDDGINGSVIGRLLSPPDVAGYASWLLKHPSAWSSFDSVMKEAKGKKVVVFLDYDGTLSPIVEDPDKAFMSAEMRAAVREVAKYFPTSIISGRSRDKVKEFVQLNDVYYAGSHGMDIMAPPRAVKSCDKKGNEGGFQPAKLFLPAIQEISLELEDKIREIQGARIEDNRFCISVHYRQVPPKDHRILKEKVKSLVENRPEFRLTEGKMVLEVRPSIEWNKGDALNYLLNTLGFSNHAKDVLPLYIGDDRTDEDAFKVIAARREGFPIIVSSIPKDTIAWYSLRDPSEVLAFLLRLAKWKKS